MNNLECLQKKRSRLNTEAVFLCFYTVCIWWFYDNFVSLSIDNQ